VDVALYESVFNLLEAVIPEYDGAGVIREPSGSTVTGIVPTNTYLCADHKYVIIGGNGDSIFQRLMKAAGRPEMASDVRLSSNAGRVEHEGGDRSGAIQLVRQPDGAEVLAILEQANVPAGPIYSAADMLADPHFQARGLFEQVEINGKPEDPRHFAKARRHSRGALSGRGRRWAPITTRYCVRGWACQRRNMLV
jgi:crotonobetainyl-CoA:carnitine CoA-transferase CaiB-like acyl-CoA transferase